jgi:protein ImuB
VFAEPISTSEDMARSVADLAQKLCTRLGDHGLGARRFEAVFHRVDGATARREVAAALPARDPKRLAALFAPKIETLDPGFGVEVVMLFANAVEPLRVAQTDLVDAATDARDADLAPLIDRLRNTLGENRVWRAVPKQSHVPERAVGKAEPLAPATGVGWDPDKPRPIRLFARPEPIEAIAPVPDDPPALIRWRGRLHRIRRAEGPERIAAEWWRSPWEEMRGAAGVERVRDYYRVEDETGVRFWVFRTGLYDGERPTRWWLHGVFA